MYAHMKDSVLFQVAENLVQRDGDFLIRDSRSIPGSYVLTCQWRNAAQHFKINKKVKINMGSYKTDKHTQVYSKL